MAFLLPFEGDPVDDRVLDDRDDQTAAGVVDADVGKQAGRVKRLQAFVDFHGAEPAARTGAEIGAHGVGLDPAVALHDDRIDALRDGNVGRDDGSDPRADKDTAEDHTAKGKSPNQPHTQSHAQRAL